MYESKFRPEIEKKIGSLLFKNIELSLKTFSPEIIADLQEENKLTTEYDKLISSAQIEYEGKTHTLAQIAPFHTNPDRAVRKSSLEARVKWLQGKEADLDRIFDDLVKIRTKIAQKLGYKNYIELGYYRMTRNSYNESMVAAFRESVVNNIVPIAEKLKAQQAERIGLPGKLELYDDGFEFPKGNPKPKGTPEEIFAHGKEMYHQMSKETAEFIDFMLENDLFDVLTRKGKSAGGYCTEFAAYGSPFIFANFNGTSGDIDVLTHEAGHAFASYQARDIFPKDLRSPTFESCEIHSMSMEFFAWPYMEGFFKEDTIKYKLGHLAGAMTFIPYGTMVDHFQHLVYEKPEMTPAERNACWKELEGTYRPWLNLNFPYYEEGRRWQIQTHIYERPFYYIDYCLAQTVALEFWALAQNDYEGAWGKYMSLVSLAGTKTFTELVESAKLDSPFVDKALNSVADIAVKWLEAQPVVE